MPARDDGPGGGGLRRSPPPWEPLEGGGIGATMPRGTRSWA
jgi:hypothetical protein